MSNATRSHATVFHLTHAKAGSQWIYQVLNALFPHRIVYPQELNGQFHDLPMMEGGIYPTLYITREEFESTTVPVHHRKFFVMRDLRDTLVSEYFSLKHSHPARPDDSVSQLRTSMTGMTDEEGMDFLLSPVMDDIARTQLSWLGSDVPIYRYEDALLDSMDFFSKMLDHCELRVSHAMLKNVIESMSFENRSGRRRGEEDLNSHYRRGVKGDWQNHLKGGLLEKFYARFASVLVKTGYETAETIPMASGETALDEKSLQLQAPEPLNKSLHVVRSYRRTDYAQLHQQWQQRGPARPEYSIQLDRLITGTGWYPVEEQEGQSFCWVADEAEITVRRPSGSMTHLQLELEPGPSLEFVPANLSVLDRSGQVITANEIVAARQWITLDLSACAGDTGEDWELLFKVEGAGASVPGDARTMSYRVYRLGWGRAAGARQDAWGMEEQV